MQSPKGKNSHPSQQGFITESSIVFPVSLVIYKSGRLLSFSESDFLQHLILLNPKAEGAAGVREVGSRAERRHGMQCWPVGTVVFRGSQQMKGERKDKG